MNKSVIDMLTEAAGASRPGGREGVGLFLLRLLAWDKLDRGGELPEDVRLTGAADHPQVREFIERGLHRLSGLPALGEDAAAFADKKGVPEDLAEEELRRALAVMQAARGRDVEYGEAVEVCLRLEGKGGPFASVPEDVADLAVRLAGVGPADAVYCPFSPSLRLAEVSSRTAREVYVEGRGIAGPVHLLNILLGRSIRVRAGDPITSPSWTDGGGLTAFDVALAHGPFRVKYPEDVLLADPYGRFPERTLYSDVLHMRHALAQTRGRAVFVVPNAFLFKTAGGERKFKEKAVVEGILRAVVGLPAGVAAATGGAVSLLVFDTRENREAPLFIDASSNHFYEQRKGRGPSEPARLALRNTDEILRIFEGADPESRYAHQAWWEECDVNDYNLLPERYVKSGESHRLESLLGRSEKVELGELAELLRTQSLSAYQAADGEECLEVSVTDIEEDGYVRARPDSKRISIDKRAVKKLRHQLLRPHDILLAVKGSKGTVGRVGLVPSDLEGQWFANQSFQVVRVKPNPHVEDPLVLFRYLKSPAGQALVQSLSGGESVRLIQTKDVKALPVIVPPKKEQAAIAAEHGKLTAIYDEISKLRARASELEGKRWAI